MALIKRILEKIKLPEKQAAGLKTFLLQTKKSLVKFFTKLGAHIFHFGRYGIYRFMKFSKKAGRRALKKPVALMKKVAGFICAVVRRIALSVTNRFKAHREVISAQKEESGVFGAVLFTVKSFFKALWARKKIIITVFNYAAPVVAIVFLFNIVGYASNVKYGVSVVCNGEVIGVAHNEAEVKVAQQELQNRIVYVDGDKQLDVLPTYSVQKLSADQKVNTSDELADKMIQNADIPVSEAFGFYENGVFKGAVKDKAPIEATLEAILAKYRTGVAGETVNFVDKFELKKGLYLENGIVEPTVISDALNSQKTVEAYYTVVAGDAPTSIAQKVGMPYADLKALNPNIESRCMVGDKILLNRSEPTVSVSVSRTETYDAATPYTSEKVDDATKYKGTQTVLVKGVNGTERITANVSYVNGYEKSREVVTRAVISSPTNEKIAVGTKSTGASAFQIRSSGQFMWPVAGGYMSQGFKGVRHKGIDIAASYGTPIYAADSGVVTASGFSAAGGGYGNSILISHGDGWVTLYGHASKLMVRAGQTVQKGDLIALVGNTGDSQGNHCHFEIHHYNSLLNPDLYV